MRLGVLLIAAALLPGSYSAYVLVWTNKQADAATSDAVDDLRRQWMSRPSTEPAHAGSHPSPAVRPHAGRPFALMSIARLGATWHKPVLEGSGHGPGGISERDLGRGVVHYPGTALPGQVGNFAVAGHRATQGEPFRRLDRVRPGDAVVIETAAERLTYVVRRTEIVTPSDSSALWAVPLSKTDGATEPTLTLTTCHPRWSSSQRLIVVATLTSRTPVTH